MSLLDLRWPLLSWPYHTLETLDFDLESEDMSMVSELEDETSYDSPGGYMD